MQPDSVKKFMTLGKLVKEDTSTTVGRPVAVHPAQGQSTPDMCSHEAGRFWKLELTNQKPPTSPC